MMRTAIRATGMYALNFFFPHSISWTVNATIGTSKVRVWSVHKPMKVLYDNFMGLFTLQTHTFDTSANSAKTQSSHLIRSKLWKLMRVFLSQDEWPPSSPGFDEPDISVNSMLNSCDLLNSPWLVRILWFTQEWSLIPENVVRAHHYAVSLRWLEIIFYVMLAILIYNYLRQFKCSLANVAFKICKKMAQPV